MSPFEVWPRRPRTEHPGAVFLVTLVTLVFLPVLNPRNRPAISIGPSRHNRHQISQVERQQVADGLRPRPVAEVGQWNAGDVQAAGLRVESRTVGGDAGAM